MHTTIIRVALGVILAILLLPLVATLGAGLGLTGGQLDDLFIAAGAL